MSNKRSLLDRLRGIYRTPINDGAGPLDGETEYVREFPMPPICNEAADLIEQQAAEIDRLRRSGIGDHCDVCDRPQWVLPDGSHVCASLPELQAENARLRERAADLWGVLQELRIRYHAAGRRPEECYEMSLIDSRREPSHD